MVGFKYTAKMAGSAIGVCRDFWLGHSHDLTS
jgi:hypothetical protein